MKHTRQGWTGLIGLLGSVWCWVSQLVGRNAGRNVWAAGARVGEYVLEEKLGEGGMGIVFKAAHAALRRPTAIKLLPPERASGDAIARFEREVELTSRLTHPNTIAVYGCGITPAGTPYYAMEYLDGEDLQVLVDRHGPLEPTRVAHILAQLCSSLAEAHGIGLIHRDIKPANVVLCTRGGIADVVKVLDFGLSTELGEAGHDQDRIVGTPLYLSPEALAAPQTMDGRSDLYAVGAVGYFLLTGRPPFSGGSLLEVCGHHLHTTPEPPSARADQSIPPELESLILSCLEKSSATRPASAAWLAAEFAALARAGKGRHQASVRTQRVSASAGVRTSLVVTNALRAA